MRHNRSRGKLLCNYFLLILQGSTDQIGKLVGFGGRSKLAHWLSQHSEPAVRHPNAVVPGHTQGGQGLFKETADIEKKMALRRH